MGFAIPSLGDLVARARHAFRAHLPGSDAWLPINNIYASARVIAGAVHEVFGFADYIAKQKFALTADSHNLDLHGEELGLSRRPAAPARGVIRLTTTAAVAVVDGALFRRIDGIEYRALAAGSLPGSGTLDIDAIATTDGRATTAIAETPLEIVSGVTSDGDVTAAVAAAGIIGGTDVEADGTPFSPEPGTFRERILFRKRYPPHGGNASDYVMWAGQLSGVSRVYVERLWSGPGTVRVFVLMDDLYAHGLPPAAEIARVADHIELYRPTGALVTVSAPDPVAVDVTVSGLTPDTTAMREEVLTELRATFRRLSRVAGSDTPHGGMPFLATPTSFSRSWIWQAIANASGEERHVLTAPTQDVALTPGQIAVLGNVQFV